MDRRRFLALMLRAGAAGTSFALLGCGRDPAETLVGGQRRAHLTGGTGGTSGLGADRADRVLMYDTYAISLYFDGSQGPKTGIIAVSYLMANEPITLDFWHGHGGKLHEYTVGPEHFRQMKKQKKVTLETTIVEGHSHKLFIDVTDVRYRVPGAIGFAVPDDEDFGK